MGKKFSFIFLLLIVLGFGGYYIFWFKEAKKLEQMLVENVKKINDSSNRNYPQIDTSMKVSIGKITKTGFPINIQLILSDVSIKNTTKPDLKSFTENQNELKKKNGNDFEFNENTPAKTAESESSLFVEEMKIQSDISMREFVTTITKKIRFEDGNKDSFMIDYKPKFVTEFRKSIITTSDLWIDNIEKHLENIKFLQYRDEGYKIFDNRNVLHSECKSKNLFQLENLSDDKDYNLSLAIDFHNKDNKKDSLAFKDNTGVTRNDIDSRREMEFFVYSNLSLDMNFKSPRITDSKSMPQLVKFEIKKFNWDFKSGGLKIDGMFTGSQSDFVPLGKINYLLLNYVELFDDLSDIFSMKSERNYFDFLKKILPEIANETLNDSKDLKIVYLREQNKPIMIGKKSLEEFESEYLKYFAGDIIGNSLGNKNDESKNIARVSPEAKTTKIDPKVEPKSDNKPKVESKESKTVIEDEKVTKQDELDDRMTNYTMNGVESASENMLPSVDEQDLIQNETFN